MQDTFLCDVGHGPQIARPLIFREQFYAHGIGGAP